MVSTNPVSGDLRRHPRKNLVEWPLLAFELRSPAEAAPRRGVVLNLSETGLGVQLFRPLPPGTEGDFQLEVAGLEKPVIVSGRVVWTGRAGRAGIHVVGSAQNQREILSKILSSAAASVSPAGAEVDIHADVGEFDAALRLIVRRARAVSRASGAAIAVGNSNSVECRASLGSAPDVGSVVRPGGGLSGQCLATQKLVTCTDVRTDSRVDPAIASQLEMRSVVIFPIVANGTIAGLLSVFSNEARAFDRRHVSRLKTLATMAGAAIEENREADSPSAPRAAAIPITREAPIASPVDEPPGKAERLIVEKEHQDIVRVPTQPSSDDSARPADETPVAGFSMLSYADTPTFQFPPFVLEVAAGFLILSAIVAFVWHGVSPKSRRAPAPLEVAAPATGVSDQHINVKIEGPKTARQVGGAFQVSITLDGATDLASVPLELHYDPKRLQFVSASNGDLLGKDGQSVALVHREDNGIVQLTATRPPQVPGAAGKGSVFNLQFIAKSAGRATLSTKPAVLRDSKMNAINVAGTDATVTVRPAPEE